MIRPFQMLLTRKRKNVNEHNININVCVFAFDLIYFNNKSLLTESLENRRKLLYKYFNVINNKFMFVPYLNSKQRTENELEAFFKKALNYKCEGLLFKVLDDDSRFQYEIGKRSFRWLKLKKDYMQGIVDTLDLIVIGGILGKGKRKNVYGSYLLACYNKQTNSFESITKVGSGFTESDLVYHWKYLKRLRIEYPPKNYLIGDVKVDHWFKAEIVWEITYADLTLSTQYMTGISCRAPRFYKERFDKRPDQATTTKEIIRLFNNNINFIIN